MAGAEKTRYLPSEMADELIDIKNKLIDINEHSVYLYDYDGSLLYSYSPEAFLTLTEMPSNPSHDGLIAQGWNWDLEEAKEYVRQHRSLSIGQMYTTFDGKTRIYLRIYKSVSDSTYKRKYHESEYGWRDPEHINISPSYGQYQPDKDFYNFYLDLSFWYEDDGEEHSWSTIPKCAIIDWGDGSKPDDVWLNGDNGGFTTYWTDTIYDEQPFRYTHVYSASDTIYKDYVITIEILNTCWRGRLGFASNDFIEDRFDGGYGSRWTAARVNGPQFIKKIEIGNHMDLASYPDILRLGSYYSTGFFHKVLEVYAFDSYATGSIVSDELSMDAHGYLCVDVCFAHRENNYEYSPIDFDANKVKIVPNVAYNKEFSLEPLSDFSDFKELYGTNMDTGYYSTMGHLGYITEQKTCRHFIDGRYGYTNRIFEITGELPSVIDISIEYPFYGEMDVAASWIPKKELPYTWDNYLYNLESITLPKSLKSLGGFCFKNCYMLRHITIPSGITELPCSSLANDRSLRSLSLPSSIERIAVQALHGCRNLINLSLPDAILTVGAGAFGDCGGLSEFPNYENVLQTVSYQNEDESATIPEEIFSDCYALEEIILPTATKKISERAFKNCVSLKTINIPLSVEEIGEEAFYGCTSLINGGGKAFLGLMVNSAEYWINGTGSSLHTIGRAAFKGCQLLEQIYFPIRISVIPDSVCEDCQSLTIVTIPYSAEKIGKQAFYNCHSLIDVWYTNSIREIGDYAFSGCWFATFEQNYYAYATLPQALIYLGKRAFEKTGIRNVIIPCGITELNEGTFSECKLLETVSFEYDPISYERWHQTIYQIKKIGPYAFYSTLLTEIVLPDSIISIGEYAFADCWRLENVTLPSNLVEIADHVFESTHIKTIQLPNSITRIGDYAFQECSVLEAINIPDNVISIGEGAFKSCYRISSLTFPESVMSIGDYALSLNSKSYGNSHLENITFKSRVPPIVEGTHTWENLPISCIIHVPQYHLEAYKSAPNYPDPNVYTYIGDQPDNLVSVDNDGTVLSVEGPSVRTTNKNLEFTDNFALVNGNELNFV